MTADAIYIMMMACANIRVRMAMLIFNAWYLRIYDNDAMTCAGVRTIGEELRDTHARFAPYI